MEHDKAVNSKILSSRTGLGPGHSTRRLIGWLSEWTEAGAAERLAGKKQRTDAPPLCNKALSFKRSRRTVSHVTHGHALLIKMWLVLVLGWIYLHFILCWCFFESRIIITLRPILPPIKVIPLFLYFYWFYKSALVGQMDRRWPTAITEALELMGGWGGWAVRGSLSSCRFNKFIFPWFFPAFVFTSCD